MLIPADVVAQHRYVRAARQSSSTPGLAIGSTVLRGLRDLGYRDSAAALCALVDNAIDAGATLIDLVIACDSSRPTALAVIDNGYGMVPEMMRAALALGVTCKLGDGPHLARNGFGLPSAPFAIGRRFDLFSCPRGDALHRLTVDLAALDDSASFPAALRAEPSPLIAAHIARHARGWSSGTAVVVSDLDRLAPNSATTLRTHLHSTLGYVFGSQLPRVSIRLDGEVIRPIDPLFLTPGAVGFATDGLRAVDAGQFDVAIDGEALIVRTARLPAGFCAIDKHREYGPGNRNDRAGIIQETNGLVISRLGRRIALLPSSPLFNFTNTDRAIRVELDFAPALDELLAPSLSLDRVRIGGEVWQALRALGLQVHLAQLRQQVRRERYSGRPLDAAVPILKPSASPKVAQSLPEMMEK